MIYRLIFRLFLQRIPAELAHAVAVAGLRVVTATKAVRTALRRLTLAGDDRLSVHALGMTFPTPLGAAAGLDKGVSWFDALGAIGFGFVEVGTVTPERQEANPRPTILRATHDRALLNRMGFPNPGAFVAAKRLRRRTGETIVGTNIGKARSTALDAAVADYRAVAREVASLSDYIVINVSSPNTPGLRDMQAAEFLSPLIVGVRDELREVGTSVPLLIKISPDLGNEELDLIADLAIQSGVDGIVAVNTTVDRGGLSAAVDQSSWFAGGGVSGPPLKPRALEVLQRLYARSGDRLVLISVGGIETPDDAWERILAGATLVQAHTGFIYGGPGWPRRMNRGLAQRVRQAGAASVGDLVGSATRSVGSRALPNEGANGASDLAVADRTSVGMSSTLSPHPPLA